MNSLIVTMDLDWACEAAIEETLGFLENQNIHPTVFVTHRSSSVENRMDKLDIGLHPYFDPNSSHGSTISEVVDYVMKLPHNLPAFRCHRFAICNTSHQAMLDAGMLISSNVCTDLEVVSPFRDRFGLIEAPIFLEDGGYLWRNHPLVIHPYLMDALQTPGAKIITIHPMHFALNTPNFSYMYDIKRSVNRDEWINMTETDLERLRWKERGIRDFIIELLQTVPNTSTLSHLLTAT